MDIKEKTLKSLEYDKIKVILSNFAKTELSKKMCMELIPSDNLKIINTSLQYTDEARQILDIGLDIPIEFVINIKEVSCTSYYFSEEEIIDFAKTLRTSRLIKSFLRENANPESLLTNISSNLFVYKEFEDKVLDTFDENYEVRQNATQTLSGLYSSLKDTEVQLKSTVTKLLNTPDFNKHLQEQIYTMRDDRIVFQVKAPSKNKIDGIVHDVSATNKTFYIEPKQLVELNNKIREVKAKIRTEVLEILINLTGDIKQYLDEIKQNVQILSEIDFHFAKARYSVKISAVKPEITNEKIIKLEEIRHPLLIGNIEKIVENDFMIGNNYKSLIITGSNTGGKTVVLKTVGLFLLMMKSGMFVPTGRAVIYPFKKVFADVGDEQNILQNLSTFSSHIKTVIEILENSDDETVVLIDELCAGTDPMEAATLAEVILKDLEEKNSISVITTHYGELKSLEYIDAYFKNACVEFDVNTLTPTYKLIMGIPGLSNAIVVSESLGLSKDIIKKAKDMINNHKDSSNIVVEKLQNIHHKMSTNLQTTEITKTETEEIKKEYEKKLSELKKDKNKTIKQIKQKFEGEMDRVKSEIKDILYELRKDKSEKIARRSYSRLAKLESKFHNDINQLVSSENYNEIDWDNIKINDKLMVKDINQEVKLLETPDKNGNVIVLMGSIRTKIKKSKLAILDNSLIKPVKTLHKYTEPIEIKRYQMSSTLDLRGFRVEEALDELETFLDKASLVNLTPVSVIHGHGTGALKQAVRDFLNTSPYVSKYRVGESAEGGDGVSIVDIN